jgi:secreted trypsin-like serine protease
MQVSIPVLNSNDSNCVTNGYDPDTEICAGDPVNGKTICHGDSGGPLMKLVDGQWTLVGIVEGVRRSKPECLSLGYFTKVSAYYDWILSRQDEHDELK